MSSIHAQNPLDNEKRLFALVESGNTQAVVKELEQTGRKNYEFTGRCYSYAILHGTVEMALVLGKAHCCLNILDEPAVQQLLQTGAAGMRGLLGYLQHYKYCKAQRTYYAAIVQEPQAVEPIRALLAEGVGLTQRDKEELLSLAVRQDNVDLARCLVQSGVMLPKDIHASVPTDLADKTSIRNVYSAWVTSLSPRSSLEMIDFILEQVKHEVCPIPKDWFKLYFRDPAFGQKLAHIAPHSSPEACDDAGALLEILAEQGHIHAIKAVLLWDALEYGALQQGLSAAQAKGHVEIAAALMERMQPQSAQAQIPPLQPGQSQSTQPAQSAQFPQAQPNGLAPLVW